MNAFGPITKAEHDRRANLSRSAIKHGEYNTPVYVVWENMRQRCRNPRHPCYKHYGGRGITVCERWDSFPAFLADMGARPPKHTIERLDNSKGYSPDNCAWITQQEQMKNTRSVIRMDLNGKTLCLKDWCAALGLSHRLIRGRLHRGWTLEQSMTVPVKAQFRNGRTKKPL